MKMAILSLIISNPNIKVHHTKKMFFGTYAHKLEIECVGITYLRGNFETIEEFYTVRSHQRTLNYGGSWLNSRTQIPTDDELNTILNLEALLELIDVPFKKRIEEPGLQIYCNDLAVLINIANNIGNKYVKSITTPKNSEEAKLLEQGYLLTSKEPLWKFKFNTREDRYTVESKQQILQYLKNLGDEIHLAPNLAAQLNDTRYHYVWQSYIYSNDDSIATMLKMINPHFIRSVEEFKQRPGHK